MKELSQTEIEERARAQMVAWRIPRHSLPLQGILDLPMTKLPATVKVVRSGVMQWEWPLNSGKPLGPRELLRPLQLLANGTDEDVAEFARRFGVLGICTTQEPIAVPPPNVAMVVQEPTNSYRLVARFVAAILTVCNDLKNGLLGEVSQIEGIVGSLASIDTMVDGWRRTRGDHVQTFPFDSNSLAALRGLIQATDVRHSGIEHRQAYFQNSLIESVIKALIDVSAILIVNDGTYMMAATPSLHEKCRSAFGSDYLFRDSVLLGAGVSLLNALRGNLYGCDWCGKVFAPNDGRKLRFDRKFCCSEECTRDRHNADMRERDQRKKGKLTDSVEKLGNR